MIDKLKTGICFAKNIRITPDELYVSVYDILKLVNVKNFRSAWMRIKDKNKELHIYNYKFPGQGQKETPCYLISNINDLINLIIINIRISLTEKEIIMDHFDISYDKLYVKTYIEEEIHENIIKVFCNEEYVKQYPVLTYRIDLYFPKYKIAIECDEYHEAYNNIKELNRQNEITKKLNCKWIRYKPYDDNFDIFVVIKDIYELIKEDKLKQLPQIIQ